MQTSSEPVSPTALPAAYARRKLPTQRTLRRWWYLAAAVVFLGAVALVLRSAAVGWLDRVMGRDDGAGAFHVVEPLTLAITLTEDGELKPRKSVNIKCEVEGQSTILFVVEESTQVKKGDLLVELASDALEQRLRTKEMELQRIQGEYDAAVAELEIQKSQNASNLKKAQIDLDIAKLDLEKYIKGDYEGRLKEINVQIRQTQMDVERKRIDLRENEELKERGWVTKDKVDQLKFALEVAEMTLERHNLSKEIFLKYERPKIELQRTSAVERAKEELEREKQRAASREDKSEARKRQYAKQLKHSTEDVEKLRKQLEKCKVYAPAGGIVQYPHGGSWRSERVAAGEKAYEGQTLVVLPDTSQMLVSTRIHEADRHLIEEGLPCVVTVPAVPGESFTGKITKIDQYAESEGRWLNPDLKEHGAEILLDSTEAPLSPGDSAEVKILIDILEDVLAVPVQCVFTRGPRSFVFADRGGGEPVEVKLGRSNTNMVEIASGLSAGDRVLMHADERLLAMLPTVEAADTGHAAAMALKRPNKPAPGNKSNPKPVARTSVISRKAEAGGGKSADKSDD
jgi:HlyD family secretion protein